MNIWQIGIGIIVLALAVVAWACCAAGGRADDEKDRLLRIREGELSKTTPPFPWPRPSKGTTIPPPYDRRDDYLTGDK